MIVHSNDGGLDDCLVLYLLLKRADDRLLSFPSQGCVELEQAIANCRSLLEVSTSRSRFKPAILRWKTKLFTAPPNTERFFGENGLNNLDFDDLESSGKNNFEVLDSFPDVEEDIHWLETGPCTNLGSTIKNFKQIGSRIKSVTIMGGAFEPPGLVGEKDPETGKPCAEFNWYHDPGAVSYTLSRLFIGGIRPRIIPWETCRKLSFSESELKDRKGVDEVSERLRKMTLEFFKIYCDGDAETGGKEPCYAPADVIAYRAMWDMFGDPEYFDVTHCYLKIKDNPGLPLFGKASKVKHSQLGVSVLDLEESKISALKESILKELGWI
jgi:inosine-uridine nucleoside N-ribohydrolase